jgi:hypothetical protein
MTLFQVGTAMGSVGIKLYLVEIKAILLYLLYENHMHNVSRVKFNTYSYWFTLKEILLTLSSLMQFLC